LRRRRTTVSDRYLDRRFDADLRRVADVIGRPLAFD
jgi:hypothetical protein